MATLTVTAHNSESKPGPTPFPFLDLQAQFAGLRSEIMAAITRVMESQKLILGAEVDQFEAEVRDYVGCRFAVGCASGSDALLLALMALGVGPGDEVITTPFTFVATGGSIARLGATPVFVDIDPVTYNLDPHALEPAITTHTKVIIPVHLYGLPAAMGPILDIAKNHGLAVIEDAAQALSAAWNGIRVGNIGTIGCFSFFPSKNLGGAGDGGMVTTNDAALAGKLRSLRVHGSLKKYHCEVLGVNSRLDALQAAILRVKLPHLEIWTERRRQNAARYNRLFQEFGLAGRIILPCEPAGMRHVYNQFTIRVAQRSALRQHLQQNGIPTEIYYPEPLHLQPAFAYLRYQSGELPESESASEQALSLPVYPELRQDQQEAVVAAIADFYSAR
jgi:dTDP-4-amino-4,6-dideoxygalactose transaminase